jgi:hypothetical protein
LYSTDASGWGKARSLALGAGIVAGVDRRPEPGSELPEDESSWFDDEEPLPRPVWWRWVALVVVISMVVATPFAYALYRVFH